MANDAEHDDVRKALEMALDALQWSYGGEPVPTLEREAIAALRGVLGLPFDQPPPPPPDPTLRKLVSLTAQEQVEIANAALEAAAKECDTVERAAMRDADAHQPGGAPHALQIGSATAARACATAIRGLKDLKP